MKKKKARARRRAPWLPPLPFRRRRSRRAPLWPLPQLPLPPPQQQEEEKLRFFFLLLLLLLLLDPLLLASLLGHPSTASPRRG